MQVVAARTPAAPVVLADRHLQDPGVVGPVDPLVGPPDRKLPAHVRLGLQRLLPAAHRQDVQGTAAPAGKPGRFRKMQAPSQRRVCFSPSSSCCVHPVSLPTSWNCHSSGVSRATFSATRFSSSSSEKCAPSVQQPSSARPAWMPWQPLPKMQVQREVSQVRSQRKTCSSSAGSGNSTQARGKSSPFSSACAPLAPVASFAGLPALPALVLDLLAFFVFGTNPSLSAPYSTPTPLDQ